jgi:predicted RNase H-like nuclease (RuvC/YqgF family)
MEDQGTYLTIGGGLVTIVVLATAFSSFMESRSVKAEENRATQAGVTEDGETLEDLKFRLTEAKLKWETLSERKQHHGRSEVAKKLVEQRKSRIAQLQSRRTELSNDVSTLEADYSRYRTRFLDWTWQAAVGESIGSLRTLDGRDYHNAVISRVTADGIEIRHDHGVARIGSGLLVESWHQRFQWKRNSAVSTSN